MTSRLIAQMKAASSRAIAVATTVGRLPFRVGERKRPHNLICAFHEIDPAHRLQGCNDLGKGPLGHRVTDRLLQTLDTLALLAHRPQKLFEHNPLLAMLELLRCMSQFMWAGPHVFLPG